MKYPIGIQSFDRIREDGFVYIDKTEQIYQLTHEGTTYFLSRPRRFGKSLLISTLACYFQGRKESFKGLAIEQLEKEWTTYPVFRIDFNSENFTIPGVLEQTIETYIAKWEAIYGSNPLETTTGARFTGVLRRAYEQTGQRVVVLIDEYDKPILDVLDTDYRAEEDTNRCQLLEERHRNILKAFYSSFKAVDDYLRFVLLTGVTKFSQVSAFSGFNQPNDISMSEKYDSICGITKQELENYFAEAIAAMAERYRLPVEEMKAMLKRQYDGYHFSSRMTDIYNPFSILNALENNQLRDYWFSTGTPTYLIRLLNHNREQMNELTGKYYDPSMFIDYKADVEKPLPMIYQSGYFTIKDYDITMNAYLLDFPNNEVRKGFLTMLASNYLNPQNEEVGSWLIEAIRMLKAGDTELFRRSLTAFLASIPYDAHGSLKSQELTEKHFQYIFYLLFRLMGVYSLSIRQEERQSQGRVDCILEMADYIYIFEFKLDGTAREALEQIENKNYAKPYAADPRKVIGIGVNFSSATRTVEDWEEKVL